MPDTQEPKNIILVKLDQVLERIDQVEASLHVDMFQVKLRLTAVEQQIASLHTAVVEQWASLDRHDDRLSKHEERLRNLEQQKS